MTRVAIIGAGQRSVSHMVALSQIPDVEIAALVDLEETRAHDAQERANQRRRADSAPIDAGIFTDYRRMLDTVEPDCTYLCLPPFAHGDLDHAIVDYGKPVLFEKPIALDIGLAQEIADHVREKGIINAAGYQKRYSSAVQAAQDLLRDVPIGMAIAIRLSGLPGQPWWRVQAQSGGMLVEQHTHAVDLMRYLCGEIEMVHAVGGIQLSEDVPNLDIFDVNACTVRFASGAPGIIGNSCAAPAGRAVFPPHLVHVVARDVVLSVNESKTVVNRSGEEPQEILQERSDNSAMNRAFIEAVRSGRQNGIQCDYAEAVRTLAVTLACQRSAETNQPIEMAQFTSSPA